ncbi:SDR family oxidoreductase [Pseudonocardia alaniniphila]|uniref:SDR family oxidoreductase n=1 Tax=Pseudonocardia alaniniphila TaxID=75291 RepID=A0ABS9T992_9PSEU|nr:SDR family oxidoreductase [Pseudonocardia alaniniphila]
MHTDAADEESVAGLIETSVERLSGVDVAFFNAGLQRSGPVTEFSADEWDVLFRVNPRHCFLGAKYVTPHLKAAGGGVVVFTASLAAVKGGPGLTAYSARLVAGTWPPGKCVSTRRPDASAGLMSRASLGPCKSMSTRARGWNN